VEYFPSKPYPKLDSMWSTGASFLESYTSGENDEPGDFFHPVSAEEDLLLEARTGVMLEVKVHFVDRDVSFKVHLKVVDRIEQGESRGLRLAFLAVEKKREQLILAVARGEKVDFVHRQYERMDCFIPVRVTTAQGLLLDTMAIEISLGGLSLVQNHTLTEKMIVRMNIFFPGFEKPLEVDGQVVSVTSEGPGKGLGLKFTSESASFYKQLQGRLDSLRSSQ
jgi:hypothetical protein